MFHRVIQKITLAQFFFSDTVYIGYGALNTQSGALKRNFKMFVISASNINLFAIFTDIGLLCSKLAIK